ncbi:hypothetical protein FRB96_003905 [Tulasnella sp. 330]|nr:hypothetical protein FRB96_003905 [Tulasnella sp. 330]KAG8868973.1 hypothetical protein FRB97_001767 [Tulasnella sp. 331]
MSQPVTTLSANEICSDVWTGGSMKVMLGEHIDDNVQWVSSTPRGRTVGEDIADCGKAEAIKEVLHPIWSRFAKPGLSYESGTSKVTIDYYDSIFLELLAGIILS